MRGLLILLLFFTVLILFVASEHPASSSRSDLDESSGNQTSPLTPISKHNPIIVAPDGMVYIVENGSGKILGSFSSGRSIYSSYHRIPYQEGEKLNASADSYDFYIDCGEDWELYLHKNGREKMKLPVTAEEFVKGTPFVSAGGGVMLGSKKTAVYLFDPKTGKVVHSFRSDNLPLDGEQAADETSSLARIDIEGWLHTTPSNTESIEKPLYVTRTDYALTYTSLKTGKVLWYLMFADIEAFYQCEEMTNFLGNNKLRSGQGFDIKLPLQCETKPVVYRIRNPSSLEAFFKGYMIQDRLPGGVFSLPAPDLNSIGTAPSLPILDQHALVPLEKLLASHYNNGNENLNALPSSDHDEYMIKSLPGGDAPLISSYAESSSLAQYIFWPSMLCTLVAMGVAIFFPNFRRQLRRQHKSGKMSESLKPQKLASKKRKAKKSGVNKHSIIVEGSHEYGSQNGLSEGIKDVGAAGRLLSLDPANKCGPSTDGRRIGRLIVTDKEIAKGSNGTIVLEGNYDGRTVAVKRLVRSHHSVAMKEIQNLIASDQHPNIVRWYGVEYDQDFVYICLERCTCNLHELILACASQNQITTRDKDHESSNLINCNMQLLQTLGSDMVLELWKTNGYPSAWLLKLMRDIVSGLAYLHELGIIHRDLKPQNVLVTKDRPISAKISDMGISKHLDGDVSSLTKHATGAGSSGWQAPEQLRHQHQTRAVDLFNLGCIFFFCITGGQHTFGESLERDINIVNDRKDLFLIDSIPEARDLISRLLDPDPNLRPKAIEVIYHPLFWNSEIRLSFLRDVSDRVELEDREDVSPLLEALESIGEAVFGGRWDEKMDKVFINDIGRYRRYKFDKVRDLLRVMRNKLNHYGELSKEIQAILGTVPEGFDSYFSTRFPNLLMEVYHIIFSRCAEEDIFNKYFKSYKF